ncbi:MAG: 2-polyprenyl-3-methyl-5-hydroxy-6-metoxy-1,4-benzoquinol methylase [Candidatus Latescibacterota bacterium]|jgi:2-polyprenyl-3-methyl-5-hydroxy-6-metoxy-1,4-benzoquinol methylase
MDAPDTNHFYFNGAHYDAMSNTEDIPFWIHQAQTYSDPILELAVGTGRIAIPLAKEGFRITGIDMSDSMMNARLMSRWEITTKRNFIHIHQNRSWFYMQQETTSHKMLGTFQ